MWDPTSCQAAAGVAASSCPLNDLSNTDASLGDTFVETYGPTSALSRTVKKQKHAMLHVTFSCVMRYHCIERRNDASDVVIDHAGR
jgi:hypothetical protein